MTPHSKSMEVVEVASGAPYSASKRLSKPRKTLKPTTGLKRTTRLFKGKKSVSSKKKKKPKGVSKLMKELDAVFSRYVRLKYADEQGMVSCYTCGYKTNYKKIQNGHYISRFYKKYRFDERNCRPQDMMCNMWKSGDIPTFRKKLIEEIGLAEVESMEADYKDLYKLTPDFLTEKIAHYQALVEKLSKEA